MARRGSKNDAERAADVLGELLMATPAWVGPLMAVGAYLLFRFVLPAILGLAGEPIGPVFAEFCQKVSTMPSASRRAASK